jgi:hypothetical protein
MCLQGQHSSACRRLNRMPMWLQSSSTLQWHPHKTAVSMVVASAQRPHLLLLPAHTVAIIVIGLRLAAPPSCIPPGAHVAVLAACLPPWCITAAAACAAAALAPCVHGVGAHCAGACAARSVACRLPAHRAAMRGTVLTSPARLAAPPSVVLARAAVPCLTDKTGPLLITVPGSAGAELRSCGSSPREKAV